MHAGLRRALHAAAPVVILPAVWIGWATERRLLIALAALAVVLEVARLTLPRVQAMFARAVPVFRRTERTRPSGAMWLAVSWAIAAQAPPPAAIAGMLVAAWADPAASLVGTRFGAGAAKSLAGSAAAAVVGALVAAVVLVAAGLPWWPALPAGLAAALLERLDLPDDNLLLAPGVALVLVLLT
jgi:dolichol kinase